MTSSLRYPFLYVFCFLLVAFTFRGIFPHNHAYGSLAAWMAGFVYAAYFPPNIKNILISYMTYFLILFADAYFMLGILSATDLSGSVLFPAMGALMFVSPLVTTFAVKWAIAKLKLLKGGRCG